MAKPIFNPTQFELRNELPVVVSDEQQTQIQRTTERVNQQLDWVAQTLGWSGPNYWTSLPQTVAEKRALLGGTFGVYNSYTILKLHEVRTWESRIITDVQPNVEIGQRVIIGDRLTYIYDLERIDDQFSIDIGTLSDDIISLLERGAAVKVDVPQNRPFPFYRPEPLASGDADFRCSTGNFVSENTFYKFFELVLSPYSQGGGVLPYTNLQLFGGSYYYFDRAVYLSVDPIAFVPWVECQWIESKGLWQLYVHPEFTGTNCFLVWSYAGQGKRTIASTPASVIAWEDPSDWGYGGKDFNPVLDTFTVEKSYSIAGLNYGLGTSLWLGDFSPQTPNPLWFDAGNNILYAFGNQQWIACGQTTLPLNLVGQELPPPRLYDLVPGTIWQAPTGRTFIWDVASVQPEFYYIYSTAYLNGFFIIDPNYQSIQGLYYFNSDSDPFRVFTPDYVDAGGFAVYSLDEDSEGFYTLDPDQVTADWWEVEFFDQSLSSTVYTPAYASNLFLIVGEIEVPNFYETDNYVVTWDVRGDSLFVTYRAVTEEGKLLVPAISIGSRNGEFPGTIDISADFQARPTEITSVPYNEVGVLNNFLGVWGNKGGARPLDFVFDALSIHGFNEREALFLEPVEAKIDFDELLHQVTGKRVYVGDSPPPSAKVGDYYWNNETGAFAVLYLTRELQYIWVEINYPNSLCQLGSPQCDFFPLKPILSTGSCSLGNGDTWQDPETPGAALYYEGLNFNPAWVEINWDEGLNTNTGWPFSEAPDPSPDFSVLNIYITDDFVKVNPDEPYITEDYSFSYSILPLECAYQFNYTALSPLGIQNFPTVWVGPNVGVFPPTDISQQVFSEARFYLAPAVQNAGVSLRPWRTLSLEVTDTTQLGENTFANSLVADMNLGPGDEDWARSFIRLPSEYGRNNKQWNQSELAVQDFTYAGTAGNLKSMKCPTEVIKPQIYDEVVFKRQDPSVGTILYNEPFLYSDIEGFDNTANYFESSPQGSGAFFFADFDYVVDVKYDEWQEAEFREYEPLHYRHVFPNGDWQGVYLEPTGTRQLTGFVERDLRVKAIIPMEAPVWDASIYKYPPLCSQGPESWAENPNNCKVSYAYFAADLAAAEDGFFDQTQDVAWREPLVEDQTLYIFN